MIFTILHEDLLFTLKGTEDWIEQIDSKNSPYPLCFIIGYDSKKSTHSDGLHQIICEAVLMPNGLRVSSDGVKEFILHSYIMKGTKDKIISLNEKGDVAALIRYDA